MRGMKIMMAAVGGCLMLGVAAWAGDDDFIGTWVVSMERQGQTVESELTISKSESGELKGTWSGRRGPSELSDVKITDGKLTFKRTFGQQGMSMDCEAKIEDGKLVGKMSGPQGDVPFTGTKKEAQKG